MPGSEAHAEAIRPILAMLRKLSRFSLFWLGLLVAITANIVVSMCISYGLLARAIRKAGS